MTKTETDQDVASLWPDDQDSTAHQGEGPDTELAVALLAAGCSQAYIRTKCGFDSQRSVQAFCRDEDTRRDVQEMVQERTRRLGKRAMVALEKIVSESQTDLRAHVLALRTALEVSGDLKRDHSAPAKSVRELTSGELNELIAATREELETRITRQRAGRKLLT